MTHHSLLQLPQLATDSVAATKIQSVTDTVKAHVDSLARNLSNPDSLAALTPRKVASSIKDFDWSGVITSLSTQAVSFCLRLLAAILIFYIGKFIINKIYAVARTVMVKRDFDRSLSTFLLSLIRITLLFLLVITVIGVLGIETSSFIAIFASAGVAIGMALSGTLQNFAGGVLILLIKPYKIGDYIEFGNFKGYVKEIQIFHTILTTYNNDRIIIPNGGLSTGSINNFSSEPYRRLEWRVAISYGDDVAVARQAILDVISDESRIVKQYIEDHEQALQNDNPSTLQQEPEEQEQPLSWWQRLFHKSKSKAAEWKAQQQTDLQSKLPKKDYTPYVAVEDLADSAVVLVVRAWCATADYWSVLYAINERIYTTLPSHGINFPFPQLDVHMS
ncbi:MAG: mechanosensitive ion channel [Muribaculaceae bacterium]|nr:mechanosensitive ion channel [Muribaculaceae bacterium]